MISLERIVTLDALDGFLARSRDKEATDFALPIRLSETGIGFQATVIQLLLTWARSNSANRLIISRRVEQTASADIKRLCATEHGLVALLIAPRVETPQGLNLGSLAIAECHAAYSKISRQPAATRSNSFFLVSNRLGKLEHAYDHLAPKTAPPPRIEWFMRKVSRNLDDCISASGSKHFAPSDAKDVVEIIYEVFANAEEWGSKSVDGERIRPDARGILLQVHDIAHEHLSNNNIATPSVHYVQQWKDGQHARRKFLEVSIFDAGIGLAQHALGKAITDATSIKDEYDLVIRCLRKYTSASGRTFRGLGLHRVMALLTQTKGFVRYRSGRLSLFRNFYEQPFMPAIGREALDQTPPTKFRERNIYLFDWATQSPALTEAPWADGALFTMIFPLKPADRQLRFDVPPTAPPD